MTVDPAGDGLVAAVPEYVHYVVLELLKNAMRATMQAHGAGKDVAGAGGMDVAGEEDARVQEREEAEGGGSGNAGDATIGFADVPEVVISVRAHGDDDVMLVVADQGGGIPAEATDKVSLCMYLCMYVCTYAYVCMDAVLVARGARAVKSAAAFESRYSFSCRFRCFRGSMLSPPSPARRVSFLLLPPRAMVHHVRISACIHTTMPVS